MVPEKIEEIVNRTTEAWNGTLNKALDAFTLTSDLNRDISSRGVDLNAAIAREGAQYASDVQAAFRQASEEARQLWVRQSELVQEVPKDVMAASQKAVALYWEGSEQITRLGEQQRQAVNRLTGNVQHLLERAGEEARETLTKFSEKILKLYGLKN
jgi:propanediol dehydratase small subunit